MKLHKYLLAFFFLALGSWELHAHSFGVAGWDWGFFALVCADDICTALREGR